MPSIGRTAIPGESGELYWFEIWDLNADFPDSSAVYIISTRKSVLPRCTPTPDMPCEVIDLVQTHDLHESIYRSDDLYLIKEEYGADILLAYIDENWDILTHVFEDVKAFCNL